MEWNEMYNEDKQPELNDIFDYAGKKGASLWSTLLGHMESHYRIKPKIFYSCCQGKPGWNIKLTKSGKSVGTIYPEEGGFSVFMVIGYQFDEYLQNNIKRLNDNVGQAYLTSSDYMKMGKWMMFTIKDSSDLDSYLFLVDTKLTLQQPAKN